MSNLVSSSLAPYHARSSFRCGVPELDEYLQRQASQDVRRNVAAVYVLADQSRPSEIIGYYTLSSYAIETAGLPDQFQRKLPRYPLIPATLIGRLARDARFPGMGSQLLADALQRILNHSREIGSAAVVVDVKNDAARRFYLKHGFLSFREVSKRLFLPIKTVAAVLTPKPAPQSPCNG